MWTWNLLEKLMFFVIRGLVADLLIEWIILFYVGEQDYGLAFVWSCHFQVEYNNNSLFVIIKIQFYMEQIK